MAAVEVHLTTGRFEPRWHKIDLYEDEWLARDVDVAIEDRYQPAMP